MRGQLVLNSGHIRRPESILSKESLPSAVQVLVPLREGLEEPAPVLPHGVVLEAGDCVSLRASEDSSDEARFIALIRESYFDRAGVLWYYVSWLQPRKIKSMARMITRCETSHVHTRDRTPLDSSCWLKKTQFFIERNEPIPQPASCIVALLPFRMKLNPSGRNLSRRSARDAYLSRGTDRPQEELDDPACWKNYNNDSEAGASTSLASREAPSSVASSSSVVIPLAQIAGAQPGAAQSVQGSPPAQRRSQRGSPQPPKRELPAQGASPVSVALRGSPKVPRARPCVGSRRGSSDASSDAELSYSKSRSGKRKSDEGKEEGEEEEEGEEDEEEREGEEEDRQAEASPLPAKRARMPSTRMLEYLMFK